MRHGRKINHLSRKSAHRKAMLANMACSLIEHKRINTTVAKAKALKKYIEPLLTKSKEDVTHNRRVVFGYLKSKDAVSELFREVAPKIADRPGGYTRIIKLGNRLGDNAEMCMIELVDFNELLLTDAKPAKKKRSRRGGSKKTSTSETTEKVEASEEKKEEPKAEAKVKEAPAAEKKEEKAEAKAEEKAPEAKKEEKADDAKEEKKDDKKEE